MINLLIFFSLNFMRCRSYLGHVTSVFGRHVIYQESTKTFKIKKDRIQNNIASYMLGMMEAIACLKSGVILNINQQKEFGWI